MLNTPFICFSRCKRPIASERKRHEEILLFLAPLQVGFFRISLFIPNGICSNKRRVRGKSSSFWWCKRYSAIWSNSREHSRNVFAINLGHRYMNFDVKHSPNVLENPTRLQNSTDHQKELDFPHTLCFI